MYLIVALIKMVLFELSSQQRSAISPDSKYGKTVNVLIIKIAFRNIHLYTVFSTPVKYVLHFIMIQYIGL